MFLLVLYYNSFFLNTPFNMEQAMGASLWLTFSFSCLSLSLLLVMYVLKLMRGRVNLNVSGEI